MVSNFPATTIFSVKSILADLIRSKTAILTVLEALNFDFWKQKWQFLGLFKDQN